MTSIKKILVLPGDGIGLELMDAIKPLLNYLNLDCVYGELGAAAMKKYGTGYPQHTQEFVAKCDAVLLGAVGDGGEAGLLALRKDMQCYGNLRMIPNIKYLQGLSPIKNFQVGYMLMVRELCSGIYFGDRRSDENEALDVMRYTKEDITRVALLAGKIAHQDGQKVIIIDKANVLSSSKFFRKIATETIQSNFPTVKIETCLVDAAAMHLIKNTSKLEGVLLTTNLFGDILSDEMSVLCGSIGCLPSASLCGVPPCKGLYEPIHGCAPDIAGMNICNPIGTILSVALMFQHSFNDITTSNKLCNAVEQCLKQGIMTADLGGKHTLQEVANAVLVAMKIQKPMNLTYKILLDHAIGNVDIKPGQVINVRVDWTLASELTWKGMEKTFDVMKRPPIHRNDRFWLAIDHTVDPSINHLEKPKSLIKASTEFAKEANLTDFYGPNQTILHTEFYRQRALPGQIIIGADSHSCSSGGLGNFSAGMGAADVVMPLVTGETWLTVPEVLEIKFINSPKFGIGGKDVILYVLGTLKRNTVAHERCVEYTGPGLQYLSADARFAIANMTTEFGGIAACVCPDSITYSYIENRANKSFRNKDANYMQPDKNCTYAASFTIDLSLVNSLIALYPSPDNVVECSDPQALGMKLDGVFIGACTTGEEDLILGALVLESAMKSGFKSIKGIRKVTPGSVMILAKLRKLGLIEIYEKAGFEIGSPGCSYCLGIAADKAGEGQVWLSSQNRNFRNRMGKGSIANLASAATCAASAIEMKVVDPMVYLNGIDKKKYKLLMKAWQDEVLNNIFYQEPNFSSSLLATPTDVTESHSNPEKATSVVFRSKVQRFGDHIDTDAVIPAEFMPGTSDLDLGTHCFEYVKPDFRELAKNGYKIIVAGLGFGSGSSREEAPRAIKGAGCYAVIAKSYAFIYARNQPNMGLLGIKITDEDFYQIQQGGELEIDVGKKVVRVHRFSEEGALLDKPIEFTFELSKMEESLLKVGGVTELYKDYGNNMFRAAMDGLKMEKCPPRQFQHQVDPVLESKIHRKDEVGCDNKEQLNW
eukprot:NODE_306_length_11344_cov_0.675767.p1 type:complete len:1045 gc:universal NODE_306_length_11344_cov_0.675767:9140-6006(-)